MTRANAATFHLFSLILRYTVGIFKNLKLFLFYLFYAFLIKFFIAFST